MTGECIFCHGTTGLIRRRIGLGGVEIDVCENCSALGQQARAVAETLRPLAPYAEKIVRQGIPVIVRGLARALRK